MAAIRMLSHRGNQRNSRPLSRIACQLPCLTPQYPTSATISGAASCVGPVLNTKRRASVVEPVNTPVAARTGNTRTKDASQPENASRTRPTVFNFAGYRGWLVWTAAHQVMITRARIYQQRDRTTVMNPRTEPPRASTSPPVDLLALFNTGPALVSHPSLYPPGCPTQHGLAPVLGTGVIGSPRQQQ